MCTDGRSDPNLPYRVLGGDPSSMTSPKAQFLHVYSQLVSSTMCTASLSAPPYVQPAGQLSSTVCTGSWPAQLHHVYRQLASSGPPCVQAAGQLSSTMCTGSWPAQLLHVYSQLVSSAPPCVQPAGQRSCGRKVAPTVLGCML
eukprot:gene11653-34362_t